MTHPEIVEDDGPFQAPAVVFSSDIEMSPSLASLAKALLIAQGNFDEVFKDSTNPHFKSKYAGLPACVNATRPALQGAGIVLIQAPTSNADASVVYVSTMFLHESGEWLRSRLGLQPVKNDPQGAGSAITYGRRYGLLAMCGVAPEEDDDGNRGSGRVERAARPQSQPEVAKPATAPKPAPAVDSEPKRVSDKTLQKINEAFALIVATDADIARMLSQATNGRIDLPAAIRDLTVAEAAALSPLIAAAKAAKAESICECCTAPPGQHFKGEDGEPCPADESPEAIAWHGARASASGLR